MRRLFLSDRELQMDAVKPFGNGGVGILTGHPVGLLVVLAVGLLTFETVPVAILFFAASGAVGLLFGFFLWVRHR